jgi:hypothetical protein
MAAQPGAIPAIHPQRIPNGFLLISLNAVRPRVPDPGQAAFIFRQPTLFAAAANSKDDVDQRVALLVFIYHEVSINSLHNATVYPLNGNNDCVDDDPRSPHQATTAASAARARALIGSRLRSTKENSFRVSKAIVPQIVGLFGTAQEWRNATVAERLAVFNAIYLADEYSIASATVGGTMHAAVNFDAIFPNNTHNLLNAYPWIPLLRVWCRNSFAWTCEIVYQCYVLGQGTSADRTRASEKWHHLSVPFRAWYPYVTNGFPFTASSLVPENLPIHY